MNNDIKKVHLIAIGGSVMHNLALALHQKGYQVQGSDDQVFEPSKSRLKTAGLLPTELGWFPENITADLDAVIVGMHAKEDNPELIKARELGLTIHSFPSYVYEQSQNKQRIVIAGSHGKTSVTSMILHVLKACDQDFDYVVGAGIEGFDTMVKLSDAPYIIIEGDEYLSASFDRMPKFMRYQHHLLVLNGIAWDHVNVFPTFDGYVKLFKDLTDSTPKAGTIIYNSLDKETTKIAEENTGDVLKFDYAKHPHVIKNDITYLIDEEKEYQVPFFGEHNLINVNAAKVVCDRLCITNEKFYNAISSFKGAKNRLEEIVSNADRKVFKDFAHSPSKLKATCNAVKTQFKNPLIAVFEMHTYSSLTKSFLSEYENTLKNVDFPFVYFNPEVLKHKNLPEISIEEVSTAFGIQKDNIFTNSQELESALKTIAKAQNKANILLMSSGNFDGLKLEDLAKDLL